MSSNLENESKDTSIDFSFISAFTRQLEDLGTSHADWWQSQDIGNESIQSVQTVDGDDNRIFNFKTPSFLNKTPVIQDKLLLQCNPHQNDPLSCKLDSLIPICDTQPNTSWTSSLLTPTTGNVANLTSNFSSDERKVVTSSNSVFKSRTSTKSKHLLFSSDEEDLSDFKIVDPLHTHSEPRGVRHVLDMLCSPVERIHHTHEQRNDFDSCSIKTNCLTVEGSLLAAPSSLQFSPKKLLIEEENSSSSEKMQAINMSNLSPILRSSKSESKLVYFTNPNTKVGTSTKSSNQVVNTGTLLHGTPKGSLKSKLLRRKKLVKKKSVITECSLSSSSQRKKKLISVSNSSEQECVASQGGVVSLCTDNSWMTSTPIKQKKKSVLNKSKDSELVLTPPISPSTPLVPLSPIPRRQKKQRNKSKLKLEELAVTDGKSSNGFHLISPISNTQMSVEKNSDVCAIIPDSTLLGPTHIVPQAKVSQLPETIRGEWRNETFSESVRPVFDISCNNPGDICNTPDLNTLDVAAISVQNKTLTFNTGIQSKEWNFKGTCQTAQLESRVKAIKSTSSCNKNFCYPVKFHKREKETVSGTIKVSDLIESAQILERGANFESKNHPHVSTLACKPSTGFVPFNELNQQIDQKSLQLTHTTSFRKCSPVGSVTSHCESLPYSRSADLEIICDANDIISCSQVTRLVEDAQVMFNSDDMLWDTGPVVTRPKENEMQFLEENEILCPQSMEEFKLASCERLEKYTHCISPLSKNINDAIVKECVQSPRYGTDSGRGDAMSSIQHKTQADRSGSDLQNCSTICINSNNLEKFSSSNLNTGQSLHTDLNCIRSEETKAYSTTSGQEVSIKDSTLNKAKKIVKEFQSVCKDVTTPHRTMIDVGFSTASGKKVAISENYLSKARNLFKDIDDSFSENQVCNNRTPALNSCGFSTASGKKVFVSESALSKAKCLFNEFESPLKEVISAEHQETHAINGVEFLKTSGMEVAISGSYVDKSKNTFDGLECPLKENRNVEHHTTPMLSSIGFSTASGKKVSISETSLKNAISIFKDLECPLDENATIKEQTTPLIDSLRSSSMSRKIISKPEEPPSEARSYLNDIEGPFQDYTSDNLKIALQVNSVGFSTASGKKVKISDNSLSRARQLFQDIGSSGKENNSISHQVTPLTNSLGFSTASGKEVAISEVSLSKARSLFNDIDNDYLSSKQHTTSRIDDMFPETAALGAQCDKLKNKDTGFETPTLPKIGTIRVLTTDKSNIVEVGSLRKARHLFTEFQNLMNVNTDFENPIKPPINDTKHKTANNERANSLQCSAIDSCPLTKVVKSQSELLDKKVGNKSEICQTNIVAQDDCQLHDFEASLKNVTLQTHIPLTNEHHITKYVSENEMGTIANSLHAELAPVIEKSEISKDTLDLASNNWHPFPFLSASSRKCDVSETALCQTKSLLSDGDKNHTSKSGTEDPHSNKVLEFIATASKNSQAKEDKMKLDLANFNSMNTKHKSGSENVSKAVEMKVCQEYVHSDLHCEQNFDQMVFFNSPCLGSNRSKDSKIVQHMTQDELDMAEVVEITEAFLADEVLAAPTWAVSMTSSPSAVNDRISTFHPMVDSPVTPPKPVYGPHDRFQSKPVQRKSKSPEKGGMPQNNFVRNQTGSSFKVPYKQLVEGASIEAKDVMIKKRTARLEFGTPFAKRVQHDEDKKCELTADEIASLRSAALESQKQIAASKDEKLSRPCKGSLLLRKQQESRISWSQLAQGRTPGRYSKQQLIKFGVREAVTNVTPDNAGAFIFSACDHYGMNICRTNVTGLPVGDGALLVLDATGKVGLSQVEVSFLSSPSVDPKLVPQGWIENHYRWLVWKLASTERSFPGHFAARCLTPNILMLQLKYRYDREIDRSEHPCLRRILERNETSARRLVLCVASCNKMKEESGYELHLTDGWYEVTATIDTELSRLVSRRVITVGTKLITHGAELVGCEQGCYPLEAGSGVRLKLCANSTRRAHWNTRLGFQPNPGPFKVSLTSLLPLGGSASCVDVYIARVYPTLFVEKLPNGSTVIRSGAAEELAAVRFQQVRQDRVDRIYSQVHSELLKSNDVQVKEKKRRIYAKDISTLILGEDLHQLLEQSADPASLQALMTDDQLTAVAEHRRQIEDQMVREMESRMQETLGSELTKRNVSSLTKIRCLMPDGSSSLSAVMSLWRATEDILSSLTEGTSVTIFNVLVTGNRGGCLQLSSGRQTRYKLLSSYTLKNDLLFRLVTSPSLLASREFRPLFDEVDTVGVVVHQTTGPANFQNVYLASHDLSYLGVSFWGGLKEFGCEDVMSVGALVSATNLQWRQRESFQVITCVYATELSLLSQNPRQHYLQDALQELTTIIHKEWTDISKFVSVSSEKVKSLLHDASHSRTMHQSPQVVPSRVESAVSSPHAEVATIATQQRLEKLRCYGEPPPLSPMVLRVLPVVSKAFQSPCQSGATDNHEEAESPPLSLGEYDS